MNQSAPSSIVLKALRECDRSQGELHDLTGLPYSQLQPLLNRLVAEGTITSYFSEGEAIATLIYHLPIATGFKPLGWAWRRIVEGVA